MCCADIGTGPKTAGFTKCTLGHIACTHRTFYPTLLATHTADVPIDDTCVKVWCAFLSNPPTKAAMPACVSLLRGSTFSTSACVSACVSLGSKMLKGSKASMPACDSLGATAPS